MRSESEAEFQTPPSTPNKGQGAPLPVTRVPFSAGLTPTTRSVVASMPSIAMWQDIADMIELCDGESNVVSKGNDCGKVNKKSNLGLVQGIIGAISELNYMVAQNRTPQVARPNPNPSANRRAVLSLFAVLSALLMMRRLSKNTRIASGLVSLIGIMFLYRDVFCQRGSHSPLVYGVGVFGAVYNEIVRGSSVGGKIHTIKMSNHVSMLLNLLQAIDNKLRHFVTTQAREGKLNLEDSRLRPYLENFRLYFERYVSAFYQQYQRLPEDQQVAFNAQMKEAVKANKKKSKNKKGSHTVPMLEKFAGYGALQLSEAHHSITKTYNPQLLGWVAQKQATPEKVTPDMRASKNNLEVTERYLKDVSTWLSDKKNNQKPENPFLASEKSRFKLGLASVTRALNFS